MFLILLIIARLKELSFNVQPCCTCHSCVKGTMHNIYSLSNSFLCFIAPDTFLFGLYYCFVLYLSNQHIIVQYQSFSFYLFLQYIFFSDSSIIYPEKLAYFKLKSISSKSETKQGHFFMLQFRCNQKCILYMSL